VTLPRVLVLAGLDPSGRAGLLADGEAIRALGGLPVLCATAVAAQSTRRLVALEPVSPAALAAQVEAALEDGPVAAVKLGMLGTRALLETVARLLRGPLAAVPVVVDPVLASSSGGALFQGDREDYLGLLPLVTVLTPNLPEAARLTGLEVRDEAEMVAAAAALCAHGAGAVLLKGGHLEGAPTDLCWDGAPRWFRGERLPGVGKRGTGCRLASALATGLAQGQPLPAVVEAAIGYVRRYLAS